MEKKPKVYRGEIVKGKPVVYANGAILQPTRGNKIVTYSVDGFEWGGRRGSAQLALSILLVSQSRSLTLLIYQGVICLSLKNSSISLELI